MALREAVETDAGKIAGMTDAPRDVMRNLIHDRTVRVVESDDGLSGFVSYDVRGQTVHVTQLRGEKEVYDELLAEPIRFAQCEEMDVELLIPNHERDVGMAAEAAGFENVGSGPRFSGEMTTRYRYEDP